jgi:putative ABC transport system permease protein
MTEIRRFLARLLTTIHSRRAETELTREINAHLQLLEDQFLARGMSARAARSAARRAFGGVEQAKEQQRDTRAFRQFTGWWMDLKLGARMLVKSPGLTLVAAAALALAIGAGAAYLEFTRDLIYPRLQVPDSGRIVGIKVWDMKRAAPQQRALYEFTLWREQTTTFEAMGAHRYLDRHLITGDGRTDLARGVEISPMAFQLFPVQPLLGRTLVRKDELPGAPPVVVLGYDLWQSRFAGDRSVVGQTVRLGSTAYTIAGVMPEGFGFPINHNLWVPLVVRAADAKRAEGPAISMFGRLKPGVSVDTARAELQGLLENTGRAPAEIRADVRLYLDSVLAEDRNSSTAVLYQAANIVFVLLLGLCAANVATLVFARTATREAEITVRTALGATRRRISAQLFAEALVLTGVATVTRWPRSSASGSRVF